MVAGGRGVNGACRACGLVGLVVGGRGSVCVRLVLLVPVVALRVRPAVYLAHARAVNVIFFFSINTRLKISAFFLNVVYSPLII